MNDGYEQTVERLFALQRFGMKLELTNIRRLLSLLGNPQPGHRTVIVGGTNGKGSVCAMLAAIGRAAGRRTGLFTSPHLVSFTERIQIDGDRISRSEVVELGRLLWNVLEPHRRPGEPEPITYFEMLTAMAAFHFYRRNVELAVMEVGLGGRLDAVNALPRDAVVLTDLSIDHEEHLGRTLASIVEEKTALFRADAPAIASGGVDDAAELIVAQVAKIGCPLAMLDRDFRYVAKNGRLDLIVDDRRWIDLPVPFAGPHQFRNTATAVRAALALGIDDAETIRRGLDAAVWPARLELRPGEPTWLLDCAHNPGGARALAAALTPHRPTVWLVTAMGDKDLNGIAAPLAPLVDRVVCTTLDMARALPAAKVADFVRPYNPRVDVESDPDRAMDLAASLAGPAGRVLVAGSIYLVGRVRGRLTGETGP
jgi:dihydrofolate synthase/folylpolyglutamate synthase